MPDKLTFIDEEGEKLDLQILESTVIGGMTYILTEDEDDNCYILKNTSEEGEDSIYEIVESDEADAIAKVFVEILDDIVIE